jgi:putative ABC transport system permease protein
MTLLGLAARNAARNPFRTGLTVLGVAIAIVAFVLLRTVVSSWNAASEFAAKDRIATRHKLSFVVALPKHYVDKIRDVDGVEAVTWMNWFGGKDPKNPDSFFANMLVEPESFLDVYDELELPADQKTRWLEDRQGAIIGQSLANQLGLKVGDRFTLEGTIFPGDWTVNIDGIYTAKRRSIDQSSMFFHWNYVNEALPEVQRDMVGWVASRVDDTERSADISAAIDRIFENSDHQTLTMSERQLNLSFMGMFSAIMKAINIVSAIILLILVMILANTIAMGVRERTQEYGALRAVGFLPKHIRLFIVGESATIGLAAGLAGVAIATPVINQGLSRFIEENMGGMFPYFRLEGSTIVVALVLSMLLGVISGLVPAVQAGRLSVVDSLRRVE